MPQAFGFGFDNEDIEDDGDEEASVARETVEPPDQITQMANPALHPIKELV